MTTSVPARTPASPAVDKTPTRIAGMFDAIAPRYDLLNHVLSAGLDRRWRDLAVDALALPSGAHVLDLCTGTADLAVAIARRISGSSVIGVDFAGEMLRIGSQKVRALGLGKCIRLVRGDAYAHSPPGRLMRRGDSGVRYSQRGRARRWPWPSWRACSGPAGDWPSSSSASPAFRESARCTRGISAICCRSSGARSRSTRARIPTCRRRSARFRHRRSFYKCVKVRALAERVPSL